MLNVLETLQSISKRLGNYELVEPGNRAVGTARVNADSVRGLLKLIACSAGRDAR